MDAADRLRRAVDRLVYLPSLREGGAAGPSPALAAVAAAAAVSRERRRQGGGAGSGSSAAAFLPLPPCPWDRADLFRRAATFKPSTWFAKDPVTAGPLVAASRGWTNVGLDLLRCEFCGERLAATASTETGGNHGNEESESENHKNSFRSRLVSCHAAACPWHTGPACDLDSLAQFPPLTREGMESDFKARERAALALDFLPPLSRASYEVPAIFAPSRLEALLQHGPRPADGDDEATEEAPEPPVLLLLAADEEKTNPAATALVAPHGSRLHLRMCRLIALYGWKAEIVAPAVAKRAAARVAEAERGRIRAAVEEAAAKKRKGTEKGGDVACSETEELPPLLPPPPPLLWPPRPPPAHPPASALPAGTVRACDAALRCETCGATAGLWSFVPGKLCGGSGGEEEKGEEKTADDGSTPPAAKRAKGGEVGWSPSPTGKAVAAAVSSNPGGPSRPRELDLISLHRAWCPFVDSSLPGGEKEKSQSRRRRVGWRWTLAALIPAVAGDDEAREGDAGLLGLEKGEEVGEEEGAKKKQAGDGDAALSASPTSERATDRLRAVLSRAGIVAAAATGPPAAAAPS